MNAIDRNLGFGQIPDYGIGHVLRILNAGLTASMGITLDLNDVALAAAHLGRDLVECDLGLGRSAPSARTEANLDVIYFLILVQIGNGGIELSGLRAGLLCGHLRLSCRIVGGGRGLAGLVRCGLSLMDAGLSAGIYILNIVGVLGLKLVELVQAILDGIELAIDPLLAGEGFMWPQKPSFDLTGRG